VVYNRFMKKADAVIIGGGAVGCVTGKELARRGLQAVILEEHAVPGKGGKCTGLVSTRGLEMLGIDYGKAVVGKISGARIRSPNSSFEVRRKNAAVVLDRQAFDEECAAEAVDAGAVLKTGTRASGFSAGGVLVGKNRFSSRFIVGADGVQSFTARSLGFPPINDFVLCCEKEFARAKISDPGLVEVFLDNKKFPGFFAWIVPAGDGARIGFGTTDFNAARMIEKQFFGTKEVKGAVGDSGAGKNYWAVIPLHSRRQTQKGDVMLVGDAAGQVKATTGGGIVFGGLCAEILAETVGKGAPFDYETAWRRKFGGTLALHSVARMLLDTMPNPVLDLFVGAGRFGPAKLLERLGDMDFILR